MLRRRDHSSDSLTHRRGPQLQVYSRGPQLWLTGGDHNSSPRRRPQLQCTGGNQRSRSQEGFRTLAHMGDQNSHRRGPQLQLTEEGSKFMGGDHKSGSWKMTAFLF